MSFSKAHTATHEAAIIDRATITCNPVRTDDINSCTACGMHNYEATGVEVRGPGAFRPNGVELFVVKVAHSRAQSSSLTFCALCLKDLNSAIQPHRAGL